jgi:hypothetical protein
VRHCGEVIKHALSFHAIGAKAELAEAFADLRRDG